MTDITKRRMPADDTAAGMSRRCFFASSIALAGASALPAWAGLPVTEIAYNRMLKTAAHYQNRPKGEQHCAGCKHFRAPNSCEIVIGNISPHGWCRYFHAGRAASGGSGTSY